MFPGRCSTCGVTEHTRHPTHSEDTNRTGGKRPVSPVRTTPLLTLQQSAGNQAVVTLMRQPVDQTAPVAAAVDPQETADWFEGEAMAYFEDHMRAELMAAAGAEGLAIGRRASVRAGNDIRDVCEPFERDQELDTNILNTVFALTGGGATVAEGFSSGPKPGTAISTGAVNLSSRAFRAAQGLVQVWLPTLAGYRTVGSLKDAAIRESMEAANRGGEGGSASFAEYESAVLDALHEDRTTYVEGLRDQIVTGHIPPGAVQVLAVNNLSSMRLEFIKKLRTRYGAAGTVGASVESSITSSLAPGLRQLRTHLEQAKAHRERLQIGGSILILGGIASGAVIGAGIGAFGAGVGAVPGAVIGGIVGGIGGLIGAAAIAWD